jgi:alkylation response protein AidB-like acyl-CoA dehydrogenase
MLLLRELGRRGADSPALATLAMGVLPVVRWGTRDQQRNLLAGLVGRPPSAESTVLTAAVREPSDPMPTVPRTVATPGVAGFAVSGVKIGVPYAEQAHRILVPVSVATGGTAIALIDLHAPGVHVRQTHTSSGVPEYVMRLAGAEADGLLGGVGGAEVADLYRVARAGACALGSGALAGALALTTAHIGTRHQFGRPLAAFQAVAQQIADVYLAARTLELVVLSACWRLGAGRPDGAESDVAAYWLASEAPAALRTCHHLHGGLGLDLSYPLHRFTCMVKDLVRAVGGVEHCVDRLGGHIVHRPV